MCEIGGAVSVRASHLQEARPANLSPGREIHSMASSLTSWKFSFLGLSLLGFVTKAAISVKFELKIPMSKINLFV